MAALQQPTRTIRVQRQTRNQWLVESRSMPGEFHVVNRQTSASPLTCTCDHHYYTGAVCFHIRQAVAHLNAVATEQRWERARENAVNETRRRETIAQGAALLMGKA